MDPKQYLKKVSLFANLSSADFKLIGRAARLLKFKKGEDIFGEKDAGKNLYVVAKGIVKIFKTTIHGKAKTFALLEEGDFFGEMALLGSPQRSAGAKALQDSEIIVLPKMAFTGILRKYPKITERILFTICERLRSADREIEELTFQSLIGRVALTLLRLADKYGLTTGKGVEITLNLTHQEISDIIGTSREIITKILQQFRRAGAISIAEHRIILINPEKLKSWVW